MHLFNDNRKKNSMKLDLQVLELGCSTEESIWQACQLIVIDPPVNETSLILCQPVMHICIMSTSMYSIGLYPASITYIVTFMEFGILGGLGEIST